MFFRQQAAMVAHQAIGMNNHIIYLNSWVRMFKNRFPVTPALEHGVIFFTVGVP
jgi:hypothetical protein